MCLYWDGHCRTRTCDNSVMSRGFWPTELNAHLMRVARLELARCYHHWILSPRCLPIPPYPHIQFLLYTQHFHIELVCTFYIWVLLYCIRFLFLCQEFYQILLFLPNNLCWWFDLLLALFIISDTLLIVKSFFRFFYLT